MGHKLAVLGDLMEKQGLHDPAVHRAFLLVAPLLAENEAISAYLQEADRPDLRSALPEVTSINEAVILATMEYRLSPSQQALLTRLLTQHMARVAQSEPSNVEPSPSP